MALVNGAVETGLIVIPVPDDGLNVGTPVPVWPEGLKVREAFEDTSVLSVPELREEATADEEAISVLLTETGLKGIELDAGVGVGVIASVVLKGGNEETTTPDTTEEAVAVPLIPEEMGLVWVSMVVGAAALLEVSAAVTGQIVVYSTTSVVTVPMCSPVDTT